MPAGPTASEQRKLSGLDRVRFRPKAEEQVLEAVKRQGAREFLVMHGMTHEAIGELRQEPGKLAVRLCDEVDVLDVAETFGPRRGKVRQVRDRILQP